MKEIVSIIIPVYNTSKYLDECITSAINQTYKNLEIVLVDDGSSDTSLDICKKYLKDNRVKVIEKKHKGVSYARNEGLKVSTGKYVMFLDSDDYYNNDYVENMYNALTSNKCDVVISGFCLVYKKRKKIFEYINASKLFKFSDIVEYMINTSCFNSASKVLIKKSIIDDNNITFDTSLICFEDYKFSFDVLSNSNRIYYLSNCLYNYRVHHNSSSQKLEEEKVLKRFYDNIEVLDYIKSNTTGLDKLIDNRKYNNITIMLRQLSKCKKMNYKRFKEITIQVLDKFYEKIPKESINIKEVDFDRKINRIRTRLIYKNRFLTFYLLARLEQIVLKIIR